MKRRRWIKLNPAYQNLPKRIEPEKLEELVINLRKSTKDIGKMVIALKEQYSEELNNQLKILRLKRNAIEKEIIEGHLKLGISIALDLTTDSDREELISEMEYAIVKAVREARRGTLVDTNITGYIISYVKHYIRDLIQGDHIIGVSPRTIRYWNQIGKVKTLPVRVALIEDIPYKKDDSDQPVQLSNHYSRNYITPTTEPDTSEIEIKEILEKIANGPIERRIIELKASRYTLEEIGKIIGYSKSQISTLMYDIERRFDSFMKDSG